MSSHEIILYYKYVFIENPEAFMKEQRLLCEKLGFNGRIIIAKEGLNGTVEGTKEKITEYCNKLTSDSRFTDINFKRSPGTGRAFPKLSIKVRKEIVTGGLGEEDINPQKLTGTYLSAADFHSWIEKKEDFAIVDMRNDYEHRVGHFENSILPPISNFRDIPKILPQLEYLKDKKVVAVCTGGVRCEKASGYLMKKGFKHVFQLHNGIVSYMEKYPTGAFKGSLYVFDNRMTIAFAGPEKRGLVGRCDKCRKPSEAYVNCSNEICHRHFICCSLCRAGEEKVFCNENCRQILIHPIF